MRALLAAVCATFVFSANASTLGPHQRIEREIAPGESHAFDVLLRAGDFVRVVVDDHDESVTLSLSTPEGRPIESRANPITAEKIIRVATVADTDGLHRIEISPLKSATKTAKYAVTIAELRTATEADRARVAAERLIFEGERSRSTGGTANLRAAAAKYAEAVPLLEKANDRVLLAATFHLCGLVHDYLSELAQSATCYERGIEVRRESGDARGEGETLANLAPVYRQMGNVAKARESLERALVLLAGTGDARSEGTAYHNLGTVLWNLAEYERAADAYSQAVRIRNASGQRTGEAESMTGLAVALRNMGRTQQALELYAQALQVKRELGDRRGEMTTLHNLGTTYSTLGDFAKAIERAGEALTIAREIGDRQWEGNALVTRGIAERGLGEYAKSLESFRQSLELRTALGNKRGQAEVLSNMGLLQETLGDARAALALYERALPLNREMQDRRGEGFTLANLGSVHAKLGDAAKARELFAQALTIQRDIGDENGLAQTLLSLARTQREEGKLAEARTTVEEAIAVIESLRARIGLPSLRASHRALREDHYALHIDILMQLHRQDPAAGHDAAALLAAERARARTLRETLAIGDAAKLPGVDPALVSRRRTIRQQLSAKERTRAGAKPEQLAAIEKEIRALLDEHELMEAKIGASSPQYASLMQPLPPTLDALRKLLDDDTSLLVYSLGRERSYAWVLTRSSLHSAALPGREQIERAAKQTYELISAGRRRELESPLRRSIEELSALVLQPLARHITTRRVAIVADGALQYVPFAVLSGGERQPLIARHELVNLPSASVLELLRANGAQRDDGTRAIAVFADPVLEPDDPRLRTATQVASAVPIAPPDLLRSGEQSGVQQFRRLPYTGAEAEGILSLVPAKQSLKATGLAATRAAVLESDLRRYDVIHFATHGLLNNENPELSGIVLSLVDAKGEPQDGFLRMHEICGLDLDAELVVVSACRTALGKEIRGEGLIGITRAFMFAGAERVMATLWDVRDQATAELMKRFYRGLLEKNLTPAAALRAAQRSMLAEPRWQSPFYWAAFQIQGDWQ